MSDPKGSGMLGTSSVTVGTAVLGELLGSGLALAQPASTGDVVFDPADTSRDQGVNVTLGAGAGAAPDYEGSDDYELVPLWNLRVANLYHPKTFVQVIGPRLRSNFLPSDHWRLGLAGNAARNAELARFCAEVTPDEGRLFACLYAYGDKLSGQCEYALYDAVARLERTISTITYVVNECRTELETRCAQVEAGEGRMTQCLKDHVSELSPGCDQALTEAGMK